jgi:predicted Zn-dependent protease
MGDYASAAKDYADFVRKDPADGKVWFYLAEALTLGGDRQAALDAIAKGLAADSHWSARLRELQEAILMNQTIKPHKPLSN